MQVAYLWRVLARCRLGLGRGWAVVGRGRYRRRSLSILEGERMTKRPGKAQSHRQALFERLELFELDPGKTCRLVAFSGWTSMFPSAEPISQVFFPVSFPVSFPDSFPVVARPYR